MYADIFKFLKAVNEKGNINPSGNRVDIRDKLYNEMKLQMENFYHKHQTESNFLRLQYLEFLSNRGSELGKYYKLIGHRHNSLINNKGDSGGHIKT